MCTNRLALVLCVHLMLVTIYSWYSVSDLRLLPPSRSLTSHTPALLLPTLPLSYFPPSRSLTSHTLGHTLRVTQNLNFLTSVHLLIPHCPLTVYSSSSFLFPPSIPPPFSIILPPLPLSLTSLLSPLPLSLTSLLSPSPSPPSLLLPCLSPSFSTGYKTMDHHGILRRRLSIRLGKHFSLHITKTQLIADLKTLVNEKSRSIMVIIFSGL